MAALLEKTVDLNGLLALANEAPALAEPPAPPIPSMPPTKIAVAQDEAFCFLYRDITIPFLNPTPAMPYKICILPQKIHSTSQ